MVEQAVHGALSGTRVNTMDAGSAHIVFTGRFQSGLGHAEDFAALGRGEQCFQCGDAFRGRHRRSQGRSSQVRCCSLGLSRVPRYKGLFSMVKFITIIL